MVTDNKSNATYKNSAKEKTIQEKDNTRNYSVHSYNQEHNLKKYLSMESSHFPNNRLIPPSLK
ncbi:hypothetical protein BFG57_08400 [Bacillus solimangrovi]|uniref:Uncharacterized protein n=1 Tax=Bacillus solimangrovi TaxID=1305675 RepID=A0A1E5LJS2_9BACI|nr:hypothetical protein BFG57_08400 [Bacillus solimangrovi]